MIKVLDHGFVRAVEAWGHGDCEDNDLEVGVIEAARQSTQGSFRGWETDSKLLEFLHGNKHATPFEFSGMVIEVKAPIFVFREWHRHRVFSFNEMSARYAPLPNENYVPTVERLLGGSINATKNKQAGKTTSNVLTEAGALAVRIQLVKEYERAEQCYQSYLSCGVPKELARICLPVGRYSQMRASTNLRNWLSFLTLRMASAAQFEIRQYANAVGELIKLNFPRTWELFNNGRQ